MASIARTIAKKDYLAESKLPQIPKRGFPHCPSMAKTIVHTQKNSLPNPSGSLITPQTKISATNHLSPFLLS